MFIPRKILEQKLLQLLNGDVGQGDVTAAAVIPPKVKAEAVVIAKETGTVAGIEEVVILSEALGLKAKAEVADGEKIKKAQTLIHVSGDAQTILSAERTMLNLLSRMSGIATATRHLVEQIGKAGSKTRIAATRKTALGLSIFDKKAVVIGGGDPHRLHLDDMVLIKDNHVVIAGGVVKAVEKAKHAVSFTKKIEVEVTKVSDVVAAVKTGADIVMLDNFTPKQAKQAVEALKKAGLRDKVILEASGGITEATLLDYAAAGVDVLSLGELTHSVKAFNVSLEVTRTL
jgi:nicotinate-nucleotide pyrophosphorylase (carboxylating)